MIMTELSTHACGISRHGMLVTERGAERFCNYTAELLAGSALRAARKYHKLQDFHSFVQ